ncbi:MAG TPA: bacillithiol biosynthesis cysteine-adding enzyme BshC [Gemmatimonadaceae bacterium]|nr:bacillithiol biosynthesis cysteine-adding enzyme BshC [Gemmatimonadaceae bacterium]
MRVPRVISQPLGGNPLAMAAIAGAVPSGWYEPTPRDVESWRERSERVRSQFSPDWLERLNPAFQATGPASDRLSAVANGKGVIVTTGQQPGLFGGPVYTLSKALSALAFADALQEATGVPVAPVFWAATDDTDFREASSTAISTTGGAQQLRIDHAEPLGRPMAAMSLGDVSAQLDALVRSAGSAVDRSPIEFLEQTYRPRETIGSAYVAFLRALLSPLGISVIDASSAATRAAAKPVLTKALERATEIAKAARAQNTEIEAAGFSPQVQEVAGLSLVFSGASGGRKRIPIKAAEKQTNGEDLGPNVLLRPIVERAILPTVTYIGGPAEIAYFAQLGVIADAIGAVRPAIVPRWSCTIIEPHVEEILEKLYLLPEDLRDPHEAEARVARSRLPKSVLDELNATRLVVESRMDALADVVAGTNAPVAQNVAGGLRANLMRRLDRFERRLIAGAKRQHAHTMTEIGTARGSLYPLGKPQERALNFVPLLARYGTALRDQMLLAAAAHAGTLIDGSGAVSAAFRDSEPLRVSG